MYFDNYLKIKDTVDNNVLVLVVSKNQEITSIRDLYNQGVRDFGENRVNELKQKRMVLPMDIKWHYIGRIQSNKIKQIVKNADVIHSVDSLKVLDIINKEAQKLGKIQKVLIQINISGEESKAGFNKHLFSESKNQFTKFNHIKVQGLMTMAPDVNDEAYLNELFSEMQELFNDSKYEYLSMGMSNDYQIATLHGANIIRIGSKIFKENSNE